MIVEYWTDSATSGAEAAPSSHATVTREAGDGGTIAYCCATGRNISCEAVPDGE